jgi:methanogenic corrinoid protein MtbC1/transposase-like protein
MIAAHETWRNCSVQSNCRVCTEIVQVFTVSAMARPAGVRIGELSRRVGVGQQTLRAWERRYGVLRPERTSGGYRVYDVEDERRARRMRELISGGWAASEAAGEIAAAGAPPELGPVVRYAPAAPRAPDLLVPLARFDAVAAHAALDRLLASQSLDSALRDVLLPVLHDIGEGWARGELTVAQEHFATELLTGRLRGLAREWDDGIGPRAVLACPPGERHDVGLLCCGLALHRRGWRVTYLGPDTPTDALETTVDQIHPAQVIIGAVQREPLRDAVKGLARVAARAPTAIGGAGASQGLIANTGARFLAADPVTAAAALSVR